MYWEVTYTCTGKSRTQPKCSHIHDIYDVMHCTGYLVQGIVPDCQTFLDHYDNI